MKLLIVDGNSILNRAFYGIRLLSTKDGTYTNGIYGFITTLEKVMGEENPDHVCVAFDLPAPTFRHERYDGYKAQRKGMPDELAGQLPILKEILEKMGIPMLEIPGYEADDIIGTLSSLCEEGEAVILTGDKDNLQLVDDNVHVRLAVTRGGKSESVEYTPEKVREIYGFEPEKIVDLKALMGDPSDNIPGVAGIGEKSAMMLVQTYGGVDEIYGDLDGLEIKEGMRKKLREGRDMAYLSRELATICRDAPVGVGVSELGLGEMDYDGLLQIYYRLEFRTFAERLRERRDSADKPSAAAPVETVRLDTRVDVERHVAGGEMLYIAAEDGVIVSFGGNGTGIIDSGEDPFGFEARVRALLASENPKVVHDLKRLITMFSKEDYEIENVIFDVMLGGYVLNPAASGYSVTALAGDYLSLEPSGVESYGKMLSLLYPKMSMQILDNGENGLYHDIELPLARVLASMELLGFELDSDALREYGAALEAEIERLTAEIYSHSGYEFNINSTKQLGEVLFGKLGLKSGKKTKTGYSTNAEVLEKMRYEHEIIPLILEYRQLTKLNSTYVVGLLKLVDPVSGRIHSSFNQTGTQTGRISSSEPNLQNIPVRTDLGRELRKMFVAKKGHALVDVDYSQIELRVLAHMSGDETMIHAFESGEDIHAVTASQVFGVPLESVTSDQRRSAKAVNFGIVYGISDFSLSEDIGVSVFEAREYIAGYFATYPGIKAYLDSAVENARRDGYVTTMLGRRRYLPELKSSNYNIRSFGERVAMNTPIQGSAADIIKIAMIRVYDRLRDEGLRSRLILQVHDELIVEAPEDEAERVAEIVKEEMEGAVKMRVLARADVSVGESWFDTK